MAIKKKIPTSIDMAIRRPSTNVGRLKVNSMIAQNMAAIAAKGKKPRTSGSLYKRG